jgi:predicted small metal-binding protein
MPGERRNRGLKALGPASAGVKEAAMARKFIDCREYPSEMNCTIAISADDEDELVEAAVQHAISVHQHSDSPQLRETIRSALKEAAPA